MADSVVGSTVTFALQNLSRVLVDEVKLLSGVEGKISSLRDELSFMHKFLESSEGKRNSGIVKEVVGQIRDVTHQAEDVIDTYIVNVNKRRRMNMFEKWFYSKEHVFMLHEVDGQINNIRDRINEIYSNKARYGIEEGDFDSRGQHNTMEEYARSLHRRRRDVEEEEVVGLVHDSTIVVEKLKEENPRRSVISIIGMGGLGKTTLARKIYNNKDDVGFSCRAWGNVSNDYTPKELLLSLLRCLNQREEQLKKYEDLSEEQLKKVVRECLEGKKYLVVLDDIWEIKVWDELKEAFPIDTNGSRILITSRMKEVASYSKSILTYDLPFLSEEDSWHLFCKKVFEDEACPGDLEGQGREMVKGCKGLPLSIIVLAGLVAKKEKSKREWERIKNYINWHLAQDKVAMDILKLSYNNLPPELKPCFLYLGIYPEDYEIRAAELIQCWICEGFIQPTEFGTSNVPEPEAAAEYYLDELVDRSMVQVASERSDRGVKTCRIHDLLRDLCISESKANKFMEVCTESDIEKCSSRRLSLHYKTKFSPTEYSRSHSRSLFLFGVGFQWDSKSKGWEWIRKNVKLVRVLDLRNARFVSAPDGLKTLIHLRSLRIEARNSKIGNNILISICNLWNLETLHLTVSNFAVVTIPRGMWKLKRLRHAHFLAVRGVPGARVKAPARMARGENSETAVSLQILGIVDVSPALALMLKNDFFPNLTELILYVNETPLSGLDHLNKLRKLTLHIYGPYFPSDAYVYPPNLNEITLSIFSVVDHSGFMNTLGQLGSLQFLNLECGDISGSINCVAGEFTQLEVFHMKDTRIKGQWRKEQGAMPHLRRLILRDCEYWDEQERRFKPYAYSSVEFSKIQLNSDCNVIVEHSRS